MSATDTHCRTCGHASDQHDESLEAHCLVDGCGCTSLHYLCGCPCTHDQPCPSTTESATP